ncbi:MAG: YbcC family protein [Beijerinckiaceae bacterium]
MSVLALAEAPAERPAAAQSADAVRTAIDVACKRIAPLWPLKHFVAVNPFLGFAHHSFAETCARMNRVARTSMLMPRVFYARAIEDGTIDDEALAQSLNEAPAVSMSVAALRDAAMSPPALDEMPAAVVATVAEVLDRCADGDRYVSLVAFMIDEISSFCSAYFDEGQANWPLPVRGLRPYAAWRAVMAHDRNPEVMGVRGFRASIHALPEDPVQTIEAILTGLGIPARAYEDYLFRALFDIGGWAAYARYMGWDATIEGRSDDTLLHLLAIRLAWGWALFKARDDEAFRTAWAAAMAEAARTPADHTPGVTSGLAVDLLLHNAYEIACRRKLIGTFKQREAQHEARRAAGRPPVQAAFCIDVRSEVFRRAFENAFPLAQTIGFAGFFGFPIEYVPIGQTRGGAQCPVLLKPSFIVCERVKGADDDEDAEILGLRLLRRRAAKAWKSFKASAVSSFSYVESWGLTYAAKIATDSLGATRPAPAPSTDGLDASVATRLAPRLDARTLAGRATGFRADQKITMAEAVLKAMSLTGPFARIVLLVGHGSTTVNNPHASGLDCGACGGHTGEANARVAAAILNDFDVRRGLAGKGIAIPDDCWFVAALHDTTTDDVRLFEEEDVPAFLTGELLRLKETLLKASAAARIERSVRVGIERGEDPHEAILARSRDWSQVRPEWGLAGNAAFIAAPRRLTEGLDFGGRAFLHSYDHTQDETCRILELIMTAPMVVASWINLQYFGSTVNNSVFGSGNKVLHNVLGQLGVIEGNAGDLRVGLPLQSVHDGQKFVHDPVRLNVFIAAPADAIEGVLERHEHVRDLVRNGWIFLHRLSDDGATICRYKATGEWERA